ncbi:MAG: hypothetical protein SVK08_00015 [Halobacteriota archaeon]|nr:hypothetical protein [Halobacteriota archaeon]
MPLRVDGILSILRKTSSIPKKLKTREQAVRVAMRIMKDWVIAQAAMIEAGCVEMEEIFFPYAQIKDSTIYVQYKIRKELPGEIS